MHSEKRLLDTRIYRKDINDCHQEGSALRIVTNELNPFFRTWCQNYNKKHQIDDKLEIHVPRSFTANNFLNKLFCSDDAHTRAVEKPMIYKI